MYVCMYVFMKFRGAQLYRGRQISYYQNLNKTDVFPAVLSVADQLINVTCNTISR